ncbi:MAG: Cytoplasmic membrane protein [Candidatus Peribacteria bacterium GW2011_GWB1_54_5]|nr:MAG: Cytoplasmic membrane protein [Candidatus Peribacteria bacterium GW2011_GWB1_54_5]
MLLSQQHTYHVPPQGPSDPQKKRRWPRLAMIAFWIGILILVNLVIAAWINKDTQFAVEGTDASTMEKIVQSLNLRKWHIFNLLSREKQTERSERTLPASPTDAVSQGQENSAAPIQEDQEEGTFSVRDFWDDLREGTENPGLPSPLPDSPSMVSGPAGTQSYGDPGGFGQVMQGGNKLLGIARRLSGIEFQDQLLNIVDTQVKGQSVFSVGRHTLEGYREFVVMGEKVGKLYDQVSTPVVSPDAKNFAYIALDGAMMKIIRNGQEIASYKDFGPSVYQNGIPLEGKRYITAGIPAAYLRSLSEEVLQFMPNGQLVFPAWKSKKPLVVIGGKEGEQFDVIHNPFISPDGSRVAYIVAQAANIGSELTTPGGCSSTGCVRIFSDMANRALAKRAYTYFAIADGVMSFPYDEILDLAFSENGQSFGFLGRRDNRWYAVINNEEGGSYDDIRGLQFSPDGSQYAFAARRGSVWNVVRNGAVMQQLLSEVGPEFLYNFSNGTYAYSDPSRKFYTGGTEYGEKNIAGFLLEASPHRDQVALLRQAGNAAQLVLHELQTGRETIHNPSATIVQSLLSAAGKSSLTFSSDGKRLAYPLSVELDGKTLQQMVIDGVSHFPYKSVGQPVFSPDGLLVAYAARAVDPLTGMERALAVIDGKETEFYDRILGLPQFSADGSTMQYMVENNGNIGWIVHEVADVLSKESATVQASAAPSPFPGLFCPPEAVFKDIETALQQPERACGISIPDGNRDSLPNEIGTLKYLKHLNLSFNKIRELPPSVGDLHDLRWLSVVGNSLGILPESMSNLTNLEYLDVSSNALRNLPEGMGNMQNLRILNISGNALESLPRSLGALRNLERLYLNGNRIPQQQIQQLQQQLPATQIYGV